MPQKTPPKIPRWVDRFFLAVGLVLLVYTVSHYQLGDIGRACVRLGPGVLVTPLIALGWFACNNGALHLLLDGRVPWLRLLRIRLVGDGYNALLPMMGVGGEPYKLKHIAAYVPVDEVVTALVRDRFIENGVGMIFTSVGNLVAVAYFPIHGVVRVALVWYSIVAAAVGVAFLLVMVTRLPGRASGWVTRKLGLGAQAAVVLPPGRFVRVLAWYLGARVVGTLEATVLFAVLGFGVHPLAILFAYSFLNVAGTVAFFIPQGLGVFEEATVWLFSILAYPGAAAVAFALARRARMILVGLVGVALHLARLGAEKAPPAVEEPAKETATG